MPLPSPPTRRLNSAANRQADKKADNDFLAKGLLCALIGICVLVSPYFIHASDVQAMVAKAALTGWLALLLACGFLGVYARRRIAATRRD